MSEQPAVQPQPTPPAQGGDPAPEPQPTPEVDWKAKAREWESRAKANKTAADELAAIKQANLTDAEKAQQRISAAEAEVAQVPAKVAGALRDSLIALGVIPEARKVLLTASDPEALIEQVKAIQELDADRKKTGNHVPREGRAPAPSADDGREAVRGLFGATP